MEKLRSVAVFCVLISLFVLPAASQTTPTAAIAAKQITIVRAAHLLDVRDGRALADQAILIEGDRIRQVGPATTITDLGRGAKVIDLGNTTLLPGLIDCHAHILGNPKDQTPTAALRMSSPQQTLWGLHNLQIWLAHGFTALRDAGARRGRVRRTAASLNLAPSNCLISMFFRDCLPRRHDRFFTFL